MRSSDEDKERDCGQEHDHREGSKRPGKPCGRAGARPVDSPLPTLSACPFRHDPTLAEDRLPSVTPSGTRRRTKKKLRKQLLVTPLVAFLYRARLAFSVVGLGHPHPLDVRCDGPPVYVLQRLPASLVWAQTRSIAACAIHEHPAPHAGFLGFDGRTITGQPVTLVDEPDDKDPDRSGALSWSTPQPPAWWRR